ncbi:NADH-quinone oxidoreductase subunit A [Calderihabitans maritimus]|uniref:NADH-quinone oxidoreductase subunit A n=1 Tax=Calderihabitans maritimus TaxID=1246530 RepID=A0A1Z5HXV2_9FIRM|nr:NADH-quinone oxidoreductase subunit A [Calderihabitans maritimus]GAW94171.1 NADH-quinone oxidoreductase subunit A [Calderihabitans maritimus]
MFTAGAMLATLLAVDLGDCLKGVNFLFEFGKIAFFTLVGVLLVGLIYFLNWFLSPKTVPTQLRNTAYECGDPPVGSGWARYHLSYYPFALLFVVFDVEAIFLFAWVAAFKPLGLFGLIEVMIFILMLVAGLVYAWRKGVLKWV